VFLPWSLNVLDCHDLCEKTPNVPGSVHLLGDLCGLCVERDSHDTVRPAHDDSVVNGALAQSAQLFG
jgi:hypothetical protein